MTHTFIITVPDSEQDIIEIKNRWQTKFIKHGECMKHFRQAIREYDTKLQQQQQLINMGGASNANEQYLQQVDYDNGFASPVDNIPIHKLNEVELTEAQLNQLNDEQAIELATKMHKGKRIWDDNQKFVWDFFDISFAHDSRGRGGIGETVLTIKNSEYERKRKEQERQVLEQARQEQERLFILEREADSKKPFDQLVREIYRLILDVGDRYNYDNNCNSTLSRNPDNLAKAARKLNMTVGEISDFYHNCNWHLYKINDMIKERLCARPGGYATDEQIREYYRNKAGASGAELRLVHLQRDDDFIRKQEELRNQKQEEEKAKEIKIDEQSVSELVQLVQNSKEGNNATEDRTKAAQKLQMTEAEIETLSNRRPAAIREVINRKLQLLSLSLSSSSLTGEQYNNKEGKDEENEDEQAWEELYNNKKM